MGEQAAGMIRKALAHPSEMNRSKGSEVDRMMLSVSGFYRRKIAPPIQSQLYDSVEASLHAFTSSCLLNLINATSWQVFTDVLPCYTHLNFSWRYQAWVLKNSFSSQTTSNSVIENVYPVRENRL